MRLGVSSDRSVSLAQHHGGGNHNDYSDAFLPSRYGHQRGQIGFVILFAENSRLAFDVLHMNQRYESSTVSFKTTARWETASLARVQFCHMPSAKLPPGPENTHSNPTDDPQRYQSIIETVIRPSELDYPSDYRFLRASGRTAISETRRAPWRARARLGCSFEGARPPRGTLFVDVVPATRE
jgi:hypothetical protein